MDELGVGGWGASIDELLVTGQCQRTSWLLSSDDEFVLFDDDDLPVFDFEDFANQKNGCVDVDDEEELLPVPLLLFALELDLLAPDALPFLYDFAKWRTTSWLLSVLINADTSRRILLKSLAATTTEAVPRRRIMLDTTFILEEKEEEEEEEIVKFCLVPSSML